MMALTDLTGTTWTLNESLTSYAAGTYSMKTYSVNITTSEALNTYDGPADTFVLLKIGYDSGGESNRVRVYTSSSASWNGQTDLASGNDTKTLPDTWTNKFSGTFTIVGGADATNSALIAWVEDNCAGMVPSVPDVVVSYNGSNIVELSEASTKTLKTGGKYLTDDIVLSYSGGSGGGGTTPTGTIAISENGTYDVTDYASADVNVSGGSSAGGSLGDPIRFFDYDGTLVASYDAVPSELPQNPSHSGLVSQGWNYTIAQIQTQFAATGTCDVGQMYVTESGDTEIDVSMPEGRLEPYLNLAPNGTVTIDWGDGSSTDTLTGTSLTSRKGIQHSYATAGGYTIRVHVVSGSAALYGTSAYTLLYKSSTINSNRVYANCVMAVRIGSNIRIGSQAFYNCYSLSSVSIPSSVTSIDSYAFSSCYGLSSVSIPSGVTSIDSYAFSGCYSLSSVSIPSSVTSIGNYAFSSCYGLSSVSIPSSVTSIGSQAFYNCYGLSSVSIPSSVTRIGSYAFYSCYSLSSVSIPSGVTSIGSQAFYSCYGLGEIHFLPTTPPTVANANAWTNLPTDCTIYVPTGTLEAYTSATNYPSSSTYTYVEE